MYRTFKPTIILRGARPFSISRIRLLEDTGKGEGWKDATRRINKLTGVSNPDSPGKLANSLVEGIHEGINPVGVDDATKENILFQSGGKVEPPAESEPESLFDEKGKIIEKKKE